MSGNQLPTDNLEQLRRLKAELEERVAERTFELLQTNRELAESESRYRSVVEDQTEFVCRWDQGGTLTFVNQAYCRYMQQSATGLLGTSFLLPICEEDQQRIHTEIASLTPQSPVVVSEHRVLNAAGEIRWNHWTNRALFDEHGQLKGYQSVGRDITELRHIEDLVQDREDHLKRVSRLATMGELIAGIAHEIHQPLHAAQLFAEAARRNLEAETPAGRARAIDCTHEISSAIARTATIIRHLRSFTTSKPTHFELVDLNDIVQEVSTMLSYEIRKAGAKLVFEPADKLPRIHADRVHLQQIFVDWFCNALEAMAGNDSGDRDLLVSTHCNDKVVTAEVCDNGGGTELADTERLFDAFYSSKPGRLGMGLSICKTIAEAHQAKVSARRNPTRGMTFSLQVPIAERA